MAVSDPDHYAVLGVSPTATTEEIRRRYRERARLLHPDRLTTGSPTAMARLNEAYRVLSDPRRRADYDRQSPTGAHTTENSAPSQATVPSPALDVRFPWRFVLVLASLGIGAVLASSALAGPESASEPDGVLRTGSCVEINDMGFAFEVNCLGTDDDLIVTRLVPTDAVCGNGSVGYLDRLGLGRVCLNRP